MQRDRLPYLLLPLAAFLAVIPLLIHGCSCGHDFDFHLLSWFEAARQFTHGNLHPHWAYTPAWNAGEPRFVFYPPLSWITGAIFGLVFPWQWTPILYTWLALTGSGLALYRLARDFATPTAALIAAMLYMVNPYMLFTAYERTAYAELLAAAWIPLLLHAILRKQVTIPRIAIPIAFLWLTNAPAAVMSCYALALLTLTRLAATNPGTSSTASGGSSTLGYSPRAPYLDSQMWTNPGAPYLDSEMWASRESATAPAHANIATTPPQTRLQIALNTIAGTILGLGLAAVYILPAAYERRYVQIAMAIIPNMRIQDNFLFHHTGDIFHDQVLHTASLIAILLIALAAAALLAARQATKPGAARPTTNPGTSRRATEPGAPYLDSEMWASRESATAPAHLSKRPVIYVLATLTIAIALLLTPLTAFLWNHTPELLYLQFPWRLVAILDAALALAVAIALPPIKFKPATISILTMVIAATLTYPAYAIFHQTCDAEDTVQARLTLFHSNQGTEPSDEYTPTTADNDSLAQTNPAWWLSPDPNAKAPANSQPAPAPQHLTLNSPIPEDLILNLRAYPSWHITLNGASVIAQTQRRDGLITLPIPTGPSTIDIAYTQTLDQTLGDAISLASLVLLVFLIRRDYRRFHKQ
ncbi:MAG: hypothetical protein ABI286_04270 [Edaphobacter sp.]